MSRLSNWSPMAETAARLSLVLWASVPLFGVPAALITGTISTLQGFLPLFLGVATALGFAALLYGMFRRVVERKLWIAYPVLAIAVIAVAFLQTGADFALAYGLQRIFPDNYLPPLTAQKIVLTAFIYTGLYACNAALFWISYTNQMTRQQEVRAVAAEMQAAKAELARLRLQLNPHFMCNSLNAISSLIVAKRYDDANGMAEKLADFLRAAAEDDGSDLSLSDELDTLAAYLNVESVRFGERLKVDFRCDADVEDALVPTFIMQPLVENALQHAVGASREPVTLMISARRENAELVLSVEDNGPGARAPRRRKGGGIGLRNIRARLHMRYGSKARLEAAPRSGGYCAIIRLPFQVREAEPPRVEPVKLKLVS